MANNDVANVEDVANEDDFSASLEEVSFPLELAIEEIKSMSVSVPQIITIDWRIPKLSSYHFYAMSKSTLIFVRYDLFFHCILVIKFTKLQDSFLNVFFFIFSK